MNKQRAALIPRPGTGAVSIFGSGGRSALSVPRLRRCADSSPARSSPPLNLLRFSASVRFDLRSLSSGAGAPQFYLRGIVRAVVAALLFSGACRSLAVNLPPPRTASPSGQLPMLRPSAGSASRPSRRSSSPADFPPVRSAPQTLRVTGRAVRSPGTARLRSSAFHCADSASAGSGRTRCVPAPSLRRPLPTFASFRSGSYVRPVPLRLGADPSQAQDQPPGSALSRTSIVASASCRSAPFQGTCLCYAPPPQAPAELHSGRFPFSPLRFSGCSPRLPRPPAAPCHFGVQPPQAPAEPLSCSLRPSGPHRRRLA